MAITITSSCNPKKSTNAVNLYLQAKVITEEAEIYQNEAEIYQNVLILSCQQHIWWHGIPLATWKATKQHHYNTSDLTLNRKGRLSTSTEHLCSFLTFSLALGNIWKMKELQLDVTTKYSSVNSNLANLTDQSNKCSKVRNEIILQIICRTSCMKLVSMVSVYI